MPVWGAHNVGKRPFLTKYMYTRFYLFVSHMSFGLPGPLRAPFELKIELPTSNFKPDAATLTLHALSWPKRPKNQNMFSIVFKNVKSSIFIFYFFKIGKSGGAG